MTAPTLRREACAHGERASDETRWICLLCGWSEKKNTEPVMTAPTQYNGKPFPPGTWLAHAAESVIGPRPDPRWDNLIDAAERLGENDPESWQFSADDVNLVLDRLDHAQDRLDRALERLAAVTAERDDARREFEHQKWIKAQNTAALVEQLDQARQMLADAPHEDDCPTWLGNFHDCICWKAGL